MSNSKPLLVVTGATGLQGGSVVEHALKDGGFRIRGVTRNPDGAAGQKLAKQGVEVVNASLDDVPALTEALKGANLVFGLTDFWQFYLQPGPAQYNSEASRAAETQHGKNIVDAIKAAAPDAFLLYSSLDHTEIGCPHFESKVDVANYRKAQGVKGAELMTSWYYSNVWKFGPLSKDEKTGAWNLNVGMPDDAPIFAYAPEETGGWALPVLKAPEQFLDTEVPACSEYITPAQIGQALREATGKDIKAAHLTKEQFYSDDFKKQLGEELWLNYQIFETNPSPNSKYGRNLDKARKLFPGASNAKAYFAGNQELQAFLSQ